jgi:hypothetical protein
MENCKNTLPYNKVCGNKRMFGAINKKPGIVSRIHPGRQNYLMRFIKMRTFS